MTSRDIPRPPEGLGSAGRSFWRKIWAVYDLAPGEVALLARGCRVLDTLARIDRELAAGELTVKGHAGQPRANPLLAAGAEQARTLETLVRGMCLPAPWEETGTRRSPQQQAAAVERWRRGRGQVGR
jgi:hypothetical protein